MLDESREKNQIFILYRSFVSRLSPLCFPALVLVTYDIFQSKACQLGDTSKQIK